MNYTLITLVAMALSGCATPALRLQKPECILTTDPPGVCCDAEIEARLRIVKDDKVGTLTVKGKAEGCGSFEVED